MPAPSRGYVGEGAFTDDPLNTFGGAGVVEIPNMQKLLHYICENGFEHHVAANFSTVARPVYEAASNYLGWKHAPPRVSLEPQRYKLRAVREIYILPRSPDLVS